MKNTLNRLNIGLFIELNNPKLTCGLLIKAMGPEFKRKTAFILFVLSAVLTLSSCGNTSEEKDKVVRAVDNKNWFPRYDFEPDTFRNPPREFGPFTRWWWPGNDVDSKELRREIASFAENGFAGVEIQPLTTGLDLKLKSPHTDSVYSWDTPSFYQHVKDVMEQAKISGITVDMNAGSGWPLGGTQVKPEESMLTLTHADTIVQGGTSVKIQLKDMALLNTCDLLLDNNPLFQKTDPSLNRLLSVTAARSFSKDKEQTVLVESSVKDITNYVKQGKLIWDVPAGGSWKIIAFWSVPDGEKPGFIASSKTAYVADHFSPDVVRRSYDYLFGSRTGLKKYAGTVFRSVFNDSYEFKADRHFSKDFLDYFKQHRGYDLRPWLAVNMQKGYNNAYAWFLLPGKKPEFIISEQDWRIRYDYDLTVGELFRDRFIATSNQWLNGHGLLHRTQAYGIKLDVIGASGRADIPEAEQLLADGDEAYIKLVSSGAHLYNKPVVSQESFVFAKRAEMTTPQKIRMLTDKALTAGVNQIIYHGTPYKYQPGNYGAEGWNTWSNRYMGNNYFSSSINEAFPYWKDIKQVNQYITRAQYAVRSGKPHTDVLIYFPFVDFAEADMIANPTEILNMGYFKGVEPDIKGVSSGRNAAKQQWYLEVYKTINALHAAGITWDWVNDESIQAATFERGKINVRGNTYQAIILADAPFIQQGSAQRLNMLAKSGAVIISVGTPPEQQPGYKDYQQNNLQTKKLISEALDQPSAKIITSTKALGLWLGALTQPLQFAEPYTFTRVLDREMRDGSMLRYVWNTSDQWQSITLRNAPELGYRYWLDPSTGAIRQSGKDASYKVAPYSAIVVFASKKDLLTQQLESPETDLTDVQTLIKLEKWNIKAGNVIALDSPLFDWRSQASFRGLGVEATYSTIFDINPKAGKKYILNLGAVYFTADIILNGKPLEKKIWNPYLIDITNFLNSGKNTIAVTVTPTLRNHHLSEGQQGNALYANFKEAGNTYMPAGLVGPVTIKEK